MRRKPFLLECTAELVENRKYVMHDCYHPSEFNVVHLSKETCCLSIFLVKLLKCKHEGYLIFMNTLYNLAKRQPSCVSGFSKSTEAPILSLFRRLLQLVGRHLGFKICCKPFGGIFKEFPDLKKPPLNFLPVCNALTCVTASK